MAVDGSDAASAVQMGALRMGARRSDLGWDGAYRGEHLGVRACRASCSDPELHRPGRSFEEIRWRAEGRGYDTLMAKPADVKASLHDLAADLAWVTELCGWDWMIDALRLPTQTGAPNRSCRSPSHRVGITKQPRCPASPYPSAAAITIS